MPPPPSTTNLPKKRKALTDDDRRVIRKRARDDLGTQNDLITWFQVERGHKLDQSQISRILSLKYKYLDTLDLRKDKHMLQAQRSSIGDWPALEGALFEWQQRMQNKSAIITGEILKEKALELWKSLPQYQDLEQPKFSNGWLDGFKKRFRIRQYIQHGEAGSAEINKDNAVQQMSTVRSLATEYGPDNTLNMDETGLFWKLVPDRTLATKPGSGGKKSKDRVTLAFTCSASGIKEEPWIIGKSKNPRCFKGINRARLRIKYRYNKSKWMTGLIIEEYLRWLNNKMRAQGRKVLLLLDNFSGHELGVELVGGKEGLDNVRIEWLPPNTTSYWQPLDQGIIAAFKLQYRRYWISYMLCQYDASKDPNKTVTLLKAVQWTRIAWDIGVTTSTIQKCWWKSTIFKKQDDQEDQEDQDDQEDQQHQDITQLQAQIAQLPNITEPLSFHEFIEPIDELIQDDDEDIFESVVERYAANKEGEVDEEETEEEAEGIQQEERVPLSKAIEALETLWSYELQQENGQELLLRALSQAQTRYATQKHESKKQKTLDSFFKAL